MKLNANNERTKRAYRIFLKEADGKAETTIEQIMKAIERYETFTSRADFGTFDQRKAVQFKDQMAAQELAKATILSTVKALKRFFGWLSHQSGYRSRIRRNDIEYLNLADRDIRAAKAPADRPFPSLDQVRKAFSAMPNETTISNRNRAVFALLGLTGIRDGALVTLKLKHFNESELRILQNPNEVATKNAKRIDTFLINLAPELNEALTDWKRHLIEVELFGPSDPLFPKTMVGHDQNDCFVAQGITRGHWASAQSVRDIVKSAFEAVSLPYFHPHTFRHMLVVQAFKHCRTPEQLKAWSQNFGHEDVLTTLRSYGKIDLNRQRQILQSVGQESRDENQPLTLKDLRLLKEALISA
jgi:integrase/recombinase XerD